MKTLGEILKELRLGKNLSQGDLAKYLNVTRQTISNWEMDKRIPSNEMMEFIADFYNVDMDYLFGKTEIKNRYRNVSNILKVTHTKKKIPIIGTIAAGQPILAEEHIEDYIDIESTIEADFCLRVKGDSMINANIFSGDYIFIKQQPDVEDGEIAAVLIEEEATLKRVYKIGEYVQLRAENPSFAPITLDGSKPCRILGKATYVLSKVK